MRPIHRLESIPRLNALRLLSAIRTYSTYKRSEIPEISEIVDRCQSHRAMHHEFFDFLDEHSKDGFNPRQFCIYRANFIHRTDMTTKSIAKLMAIAIREGDFKTSAETGMNFFDEIGGGNFNKSHAKLLLFSHNKHGEKIFSLPEETFKSAAKSPFLVPEVEEYRKSKTAAFKRTYPFIIGNFLAHEFAADDMLRNFCKSLFEPYKGYYKPKEYAELIEYFTIHDGPEEEHGSMAIDTAERICMANLKHGPKLLAGAMDFLDAQAILWDGMMREMEKSKDKGIFITPKPEFEIPNPNPSKPSVEPSLKKPEEKQARES